MQLFRYFPIFLLTNWSDVCCYFLHDVITVHFIIPSLKEVKTMSRPAKKMEKPFTYGDYLTWPEDERWEIIHGVAYNMSPAPSTEHQRVSRRLLVQFDHFFTQGPCEIFSAPFDVCLPKGDEDDEAIETVVQPDLAIICDPMKVDSNGCKGAPDLIIEIISPSTAKKDRHEKFFLYEEHGVKEYWTVHPLEYLIEVFALGDDGTYGRPNIYARDDLLPVSLFPGLEIPLARIFGIENTEDERNTRPEG
jgi:Uma2 family endonuclease